MAIKKETKECPYCWEDIQSTAIKCRYCWEFLDWRKKETKEKKLESKVWDFSNCRILRIESFSRVSKVRCPRCWYIGKPKYQSWSYSWCLAFILICCAIIPWLLYIAFSKSWKYVCPQCWQDFLEKL